MQIASPANPRIKAIRALRQRHERERSGCFFIEGIRLVAEALQTGAPVETLVVAPSLLRSDFARALVVQAQTSGIPLLEVSEAVFSSLSQKEGPQGLAAVVRQRWLRLEELRLGPGDYWVALHAAQDPGNIGTILRTADAAGARGVMLLDHCADPHDPQAVRASMGALFSQGLVRASFAAFCRWKAETGCPVIGTSGQATTDYRSLRYPLPFVLLMGSEREGLSPAQQASCEQVVSIAMTGRSDSLNLAVATALVLYEVFYQQRSL
ncbi:TrmH family RNA methyltransferase [Thermogemmatispora sp.]|jgi:TrmH family RNA methyltransferase|uniref:TrmH family RNA methyltransferase n=1 Tax=Thermogemmatispora sp. TaxID=1968838 RepID=UPI0035E3FC6A